MTTSPLLLSVGRDSIVEPEMYIFFTGEIESSGGTVDIFAVFREEIWQFKKLGHEVTQVQVQDPKYNNGRCSGGI